MFTPLICQLGCCQLDEQSRYRWFVWLGLFWLSQFYPLSPVPSILSSAVTIHRIVSWAVALLVTMWAWVFPFCHWQQQDIFKPIHKGLSAAHEWATLLLLRFVGDTTTSFLFSLSISCYKHWVISDNVKKDRIESTNVAGFGCLNHPCPVPATFLLFLPWAAVLVSCAFSGPLCDGCLPMCLAWADQK